MSDANDFGRDTAAGLARRKLEQTTLRRDVTATLVPAGDALEIEAETEVTILQESDGGYTIQVPVLGATCRIAAADVDSLGKRLAERANREAESEDEAAEDASPDSLRSQVEDLLDKVYDPELPLSVIELGLIYELRLVETEDAGYRAEIEMTLTTQACGMGPTIAGEIRERLTGLPRIAEVRIDIVWEPAWTPTRITEEGRKKLGID